MLYGHPGDDEGAIDRVAAASDGAAPTAGDDPDALLVRRGTLQEMERAILAAYLAESRWNRTAAAGRLGISRCTLWRKLRDE